MTNAHVYKTFFSDDIISFENLIYPADHAQWQVNFHGVLTFILCTMKEMLVFFFFHDRKKLWFLISQT